MKIYNASTQEILTINKELDDKFEILKELEEKYKITNCKLSKANGKWILFLEQHLSFESKAEKDKIDAIFNKMIMDEELNSEEEEIAVKNHKLILKKTFSQ